jgi:hypothetical protein
MPKYVKKNLQHTTSTFSSQPTHLIVDKRLEKRIKSLRNVEIHAVDENKHQEYLRILKQSLEHDSTFRKGFWYLSIIRLLHFFDYVIHHNLTDVLLVESDVLLLPNFPFEAFETWDVDCAYPLATVDEGVASVLFCKDALSATQMKTQLLLYRNLNPLATDCNYLGFLHQSKTRNLNVDVLPTVPLGYFSSDSDQNKVLEKNFNRFEGVFDASTLGLYFLGIDLRNTNGVPILRKTLPHYPLKSCDFFVENISESGEISLKNGGKVFPIFNLHIHTKYPAFFSTPVLGSKLYEALTSTTFYFSRGFLFKQKINAILYRIRVKLDKG